MRYCGVGLPGQPYKTAVYSGRMWLALSWNQVESVMAHFADFYVERLREIYDAQLQIITTIPVIAFACIS
jgi:hypothetical protein